MTIFELPKRRDMRSMAIHEDQSEAEAMTTGMRTVWCPTCSTPQDVPIETDLDECKCMECNQSLGDEPHEVEVEEANAEAYKALTDLVTDALGA